ncbi:hypothetical protein ACES2L_00395 [Bdellovibrio bacteriovorus]
MKMKMWKTLLAVWILLATSQSYAEKFKCGRYELDGVIKKVDGKNVLKLFPGSMSETTLTLAPDLQELAEVFVDNSVTVKGKILSPIKDYQGTVSSLLSEKEIKALTAPDKPSTARFMRDDIKQRVADPLHPDLDSRMKLVKEMPCTGEQPAPATKKKGKNK